jgi:hypothetical protein
MMNPNGTLKTRKRFVKSMCIGVMYQQGQLAHFVHMFAVDFDIVDGGGLLRMWAAKTVAEPFGVLS